MVKIRNNTFDLIEMFLKYYKNTIVIYRYSVFEPYYSKVYYIIVFTTLLMNATAYCNYSEL